MLASEGIPEDGGIPPPGHPSCVIFRNVKIQRRAHGRWKTLAKDGTNVNGRVLFHLKDVRGRYRAVAPRYEDGGTTCRSDRSPEQRHTH